MTQTFPSANPAAYNLTQVSDQPDIWGNGNKTEKKGVGEHGWSLHPHTSSHLSHTHSHLATINASKVAKLWLQCFTQECMHSSGVFKDAEML